MSETKDKKDIINLQWFLEEYDEKTDDYANYINVKINESPNLTNVFNIRNSIISFVEEESKMVIYSLTSNNKVLKISSEKRKTEHHKDYDIRLVTYELLSNASDYYAETIRNNDTLCIQITNSSGRRLTADREVLNLSPSSLIYLEKVKLTDILVPITIDEINKVIGEIEEFYESESKKTNKGLIKALFDN